MQENPRENPPLNEKQPPGKAPHTPTGTGRNHRNNPAAKPAPAPPTTRKPNRLLHKIQHRKTWLTPRTLEIAKTLVEVDDRVKPGDALILASAAEDPNAIKLITFDGKLLKSQKLRKHLKHLNPRLRITAEY